MGREEKIARSVVRAMTHPEDKTDGKPKASRLGRILALLSTLLSLYCLVLGKLRPADFSNLRRKRWGVDDDDYVRSFQPDGGESADEPLKAIGDMGFSGSTFYATADQRYLVKSIPRYAEHSFFSQDLLTPYVQHMAAHPRSLLVRICDFLAVSGWSLGRLLRTAPSHHIVMDNIMHGREAAKQRGDPDWENWDLKPTSYFFPERDIAGGALTSDATKSQLADEFHDKIVLRRDQAEDLFATLEADTALLAAHNAVDYSLLLVRIRLPGPAAAVSEAQQQQEPPSWRTGVPSADGKHVFRASILDFFWAKHKAQPKLMTLLIGLWNLVTRSGHMSITTTPNEYRARFLGMCRSIVEVRD
ncbi:hypothetical protein VTJ83DRAFT_2692 [Remersonia thermophila]|uniref:PIPK domain-containing protein n=1 Tax=Remersonia thermophila TaxID=72144 RepID=A0ABR4DJF1_9PEZI